MIHPDADVAAALDHHNSGRLHDAELGYRAILARQPRHADALHLLGLVAHQVGDDPTAEGLIRGAIAVAPRNPAYHGNLGVVLLRMRRIQDATTALRTAIRLNPADFGAQSNLGVALSALGDHAGAVRAAGAALRLRPGDSPTLCNRGQFLEKAGEYTQALDALDAAIRADKDSYTAHLARGNLLVVLGRPREALEAFDVAIALRPADRRASQARIITMNYLPGATMAAIGETARHLAPAVAQVPPAPFAGLDRSSGRALRIGYVSADFRNHPVGYFLRGVLAARDRADTVVFLYDNGLDDDPMTAALKADADHWRQIAALDDDQAAQAIRSDGIDILVDLSGHTQGNRLGVFARRAAPLQAAWLGYFGTTGVAAMDVVIADRHVLAPADETSFCERVVRLADSYLCFSPPIEAGPVAPLPSGLDRPITFGCFNNRAKLNEDVLALWARVLAAVPNARLLLKSAQYADKGVRREIAHVFRVAGIAPERIQFEAASPIAAMFDAYGRVDIALDPFPFAGGATTAQALWMGVPVVSLIGQTWPGRQGASLLSAAGFPDWATRDPDGYVTIARALAMDRPRLIALRLGLRAALAASPLCRADRFAAHLGRAYRAMWQTFLAAPYS